MHNAELLRRNTCSTCVHMYTCIINPGTFQKCFVVVTVCFNKCFMFSICGVCIILNNAVSSLTRGFKVVNGPRNFKIPMSSTMYFARVVNFVVADGLEILSTMIHVIAGAVITKFGYYISVKKRRKIFTVLTYKLLLIFMVISDVYRSFIQNKTMFTKYCLTQWISKLQGSFEIHWVRQ